MAFFKSLPFYVTVLLAAGAAQAQNEWALRAPVAVKGRQVPPEQVAFRTTGLDDRGFNRVLTGTTEATVTLYKADKPAHGNAAMVVCPGGGYAALMVDREGHSIARFFQAQGITVAVLKYRLPQEDTFAAGLPAPQQDAQEAIRFLRQRSAELGINPKRIGIMGFSAGGHLTASTGLLAEGDARPDFVVPVYPVIVMDGPYIHAGSKARLLGENPADARVAEFSLERRAKAGQPPFLLLHAKDDKTVPYQNSELLAEALKKAGVPVELLMFNTGGHGFALGRDESMGWTDSFLKWLDQIP